MMSPDKDMPKPDPSDTPDPSSSPSAADSSTGIGADAAEELNALLAMRGKIEERIGTILVEHAGGKKPAGEEDETEESISQKKEIDANPEEWANQQYDHLRARWNVLGIKIPPREELLPRLMRAPEIINRLVDSDHRLEASMGVVLVPPSDVVGWKVGDDLRSRKGDLKVGRSGYEKIDRKLRKETGLTRTKRILSFRQSSTADHVDHDIEPPADSHEWRVIVTDMAERGLWIGSPNKLFGVHDDKNRTQRIEPSYVMGGYDTRGMGVAEYAALTLQSEKTIDTSNNTWLLKTYSPDSRYQPQKSAVGAIVAGLHPFVQNTYMYAPHGQHFVYGIENPDAKNGMNCYRPTVEIPQLAIEAAPEKPEIEAGPKTMGELMPGPASLPKRPKPGEAIPMPPASGDASTDDKSDEDSEASAVLPKRPRSTDTTEPADTEDVTAEKIKTVESILSQIDKQQETLKVMSKNAPPGGNFMTKEIESEIQKLEDQLSATGAEQIKVTPGATMYDPKFHELLEWDETSSKEDDDLVVKRVAKIVRPGYTVNGKIVRPAQVIGKREPLPKMPS